jgi:hypothetical protein
MRALNAAETVPRGITLSSLIVNRNLLGLATVSAVAFILLGSVGVVAQNENRTTTVNDRVRPELDALGLKGGGFVIFSSIDVIETYNDNIFGSNTAKVEDFITTIRPTMRVLSDWNQHALNFTGIGEIDIYADNSREDNETFTVSVDGQVDIHRDTEVIADLTYEKGSEERGSADDAGGLTPTSFDVKSFNTGISKKWNRVSLQAYGDYKERDFDDVATAGGMINNDDRDRSEFKLDVKGSYEIQERYEAFAQIILNSVDYDLALDDNGLNRDNEGYELRAGARIDLTGLLFGDIFVGYLDRDYDGAGLVSVETFVAGVDLTWNVTPLTTLKAGVSRDISETTLASASANLSTAFGVSADHELLRNLILSARLGISTDEFEGTTREDDYIKGGIGAKYLLNRYLSIVFDFDHSERESNAVGANNEINKFLLRLRAQL